MVFWRLDYLSGYFQVPLSEESQKLTAFITPFGKFHHSRLPQGYCDSSDQFGLATDPVVKGVGHVVKLVDDLLGQCRSLQECYDTLAEVLSRIIEINMVVCPRKFKLRTRNKYGGFVLESLPGHEVKILPDDTRLKDLLDMPPPTTKAELHSFLGLVNCLKVWTPALSPHTVLLRSLAKKDSVFTWGNDAQWEFDQIKKDLSLVLEINPYNEDKPLVVYSDASYNGGFRLYFRAIWGWRYL